MTFIWIFIWCDCDFYLFFSSLIKFLLLRWMLLRLRGVETARQIFSNKVVASFISGFQNENFPMVNHPETRIENVERIAVRVAAGKPHQNLYFSEEGASRFVEESSLPFLAPLHTHKIYEPWSVKKLWHRASVSCCEKNRVSLCAL